MTVTASSISLENLRFYAFHGVMPQEQRVGGTFVVSVTADCNLSKAAESDRVEDTVNYAEVYAVVEREMQKPSRLLEHVAGRMARAILNDFPQVERVHVSLTKRNPPMGADGQGATVRMTVER